MHDKSELLAVLAAYRRYAPVYDAVFGRVLMPGRIRVCAEINRLRPRRILEVGVGTGLSLPHYDRAIDVVGVDLSAEMLTVARRRVAQAQLGNVSLHRADASATCFAAASFDVVVASYVLSVAPNPGQVLQEMRRLCAPGGVMIICNHSMRPGARSWLPRRVAAPLSRWLGWRPDFALFDELHSSGVSVMHSRRIAPFGLFTLVTCAP